MDRSSTATLGPVVVRNTLRSLRMLTAAACAGGACSSAIGSNVSAIRDGSAASPSPLSWRPPPAQQPAGSDGDDHNADRLSRCRAAIAAAAPTAIVRPVTVYREAARALFGCAYAPEKRQ
eukprot:scaffold3596_cov316-Prasinococcus_capsulatus_cf.AAC.6